MSNPWLFSGTPEEFGMFAGIRNLSTETSTSGYIVVMILNSGLIRIGSTENINAHVRSWQSNAKKVGKTDLEINKLLISMPLGRDAAHIRNALKKKTNHLLIDGTDLYQASDDQIDDEFRLLFNRWLEIKSHFHDYLKNIAEKTANGDVA